VSISVSWSLNESGTTDLTNLSWKAAIYKPNCGLKPKAINAEMISHSEFIKNQRGLMGVDD